MSGQIPPYGRNYRLVHVGEYSPIYSQSMYTNRHQPIWSIRAEKGSKVWWIWHGTERISPAFGSLTAAMHALDGIIFLLWDIPPE